MFPMLPASIPSPDPVWSQFQLGPLTIHTYALCILAGMIAAVIITQRRLSRRGGTRDMVLDIVIWAIPLGLVGARFYHVFTHGGDYFFPGADLWKVFAIWDGGNALYGSLLGGAVLTETTFEWKGLGFQLAAYLKARDFVAVQGIVAVLAVIVAVTNFLVDILAALIDPRVRY